jgi:hypothetical protein
VRYRKKIAKTNLFCNQCRDEANKGKYNPNWHGGKPKRRKDGYMFTYFLNHPFAIKKRYVLEHRYVVEKWLKKQSPNSKYLIKVDGFPGKWLSPICVIHHKNNNCSDNRLNNLKLFPNNAEHARYHGHGRDMEAMRKARVG